MVKLKQSSTKLSSSRHIGYMLTSAWGSLVKRQIWDKHGPPDSICKLENVQRPRFTITCPPFASTLAQKENHNYSFNPSLAIVNLLSLHFCHFLYPKYIYVYQLRWHLGINTDTSTERIPFAITIANFELFNYCTDCYVSHFFWICATNLKVAASNFRNF